MDTALQEFDQEWKTGDRVKAKQMAIDYVNEHREALTTVLGQLPIETLVALISGYRKVGRDADRVIADMWLLSEYEPQHIGGTVHLNRAQAVAAAEAVLKERS